MQLTLENVLLTPGATIGTGVGRTEDGRRFRFAGDWRPLMQLARILDETQEPVLVEVEPYQLLGEVVE